MSEVVVREQISLLAKIQVKDDALTRLKRQIFEGPSRIEAGEERVRRLAEALEEDKERLKEVQALQRQCERDVEDGLEQIKRSKGRLLNIKSNKEYQAVLKEIEETEKANREREDRILVYMEELEALQERLREKEAELSGVRKIHEEEKAALQKELRAAEAELAEQELQKKDMAAAVDVEILKIYNRLRHRLGGYAVAWVENATCSACHMNIPPQMYNELQRMDSLRFCPNCDRVIYWKNGDKASDDGMSE